jgi:methylmalonyl-CoA/ethylmalonyl-CoA epimerase
MKMTRTIHHLNFLVKDLDQAVESYRSALQLDIATYDNLEQRNVRTARFKLGDSWLILVQPLDEESIPAQHLAEHGEGFFLMSISTQSLDKEITRLAKMPKIGPLGEKRQGLDGWQVADFPRSGLHGAQLQFCETEQI